MIYSSSPCDRGLITLPSLPRVLAVSGRATYGIYVDRDAELAKVCRKMLERAVSPRGKARMLETIHRLKPALSDLIRQGKLADKLEQPAVDAEWGSTRRGPYRAADAT